MWNITVRRDPQKTIRRQIYEQFRAQILSGALAADEALPSTRTLAKLLGVARSTVVEAYDMLLAEGFLQSAQGAATRVAPGAAVSQTPPAPPMPKAATLPPIRADFRTGQPDLTTFPRRQWHNALLKAVATLPLSEYAYSGAQGLYALRAEVCEWLLRSRGFAVRPEDVFITAGATHALHLLAGLLCAPGDRVLTEDPCHTGMLKTFLQQGCEVVPIPADEQGLQPWRLMDGLNARALYVTPSHQFPLGGVMPASRRAAVIRYAREQDLYVIEDDYDSEFRYAGSPVAPLCALDPQRVAYVGTFSKTMFPALRIGFAVLPQALQQGYSERRQYTDVQNSPFEQAALAALMRSRALDRHIHRMKKLYAARREALLTALSAAFGDHALACGDATGLHVTVDFPGRAFYDSFYQRCREAGVRVTPLETYAIVKDAHTGALVLGYGHLTPDAIAQGIKLLATVIDP